MENIKDLYYREIKIPFTAIHFTKKDIVTRSGTILNFYQKTILLILKKGIKAIDTDDLAKKISVMLNIKYLIVKHCVEYFYKMKIIKLENGIYVLGDDVNCTYSEKNSNVMLANVKMGKDNLNYVYLSEIGTLLTQKLIDEYKITSTEKLDAPNYSDELLNQLDKQLMKLNEKGIPLDLASKSLSNTVCEKVQIKLEDLKELKKSMINIPLKISYIYNRDLAKGVYHSSELNFSGSSILSNYFDNTALNLKLSLDYEHDTKKPDYILYEENLEQEKQTRLEIEKKSKEVKKLQADKISTEETIKAAKKKIDDKNAKIKELKKQLKELQEDNKEYKEKFLILEKEQASVKDDDNNLKELNKKLNVLQQETSSSEKEIKNIIKNYNDDYEKKYTDSFERKLLMFEKNNNKLYDKYKNVYEENSKILQNLLSMSKKINDNSNMVEEWFYLYKAFTCYLKFILSILLNREPNTINSFKSELVKSNSNNDMTNNNNRMDLGLKYGLSGDIIDSLIITETCTDHLRHKFDSKQFSADYKSKNENNFARQEEVYNNFKNLSKESKKNILYSIISLIEKANFTEDKYETLEKIIINYYNTTL